MREIIDKLSFKLKELCVFIKVILKFNACDVLHGAEEKLSGAALLVMFNFVSPYVCVFVL